jgi:hypothetical protein
MFILTHAKERVFHLLGWFPFPVSKLEIRANNKEDKITGHLKISEIFTYKLNKTQKPCFENSNIKGDYFSSCAINRIGSFLDANIRCLIPGIEEFTTTAMKKVECINRIFAMETFGTFNDEVLNVFPRRPFQFGCLVPCRQSTFQLEFEYFHKNSFLGFVSEVKRQYAVFLHVSLTIGCDYVHDKFVPVNTKTIVLSLNL